jgi:polar amino acid transport system substrate-binding protein
MKKILIFIFILICIVVLGFVVIGLEKQESNVINIGITDYPPLNYYENGKLIGFETEFAEEVCKELGMAPNFIEIDWGSKEVELKSKNIDVIWNGMTWTEERAENMLLSDKYINNMGVLVVKKGTTDITSVAVEKGSQGEVVVDSDSFFDNKEIVKVDSMTKGFLEIASGNVTATYCDYVAALGMLDDDGDFTDFVIWEGYKGEADQFAIGLRKADTELCKKINKIMSEMKSDGRFKKIADKYGLGDLI